MHAPEATLESHVRDLGDYIGMESCVDLETDVNIKVCGGGGGGGGGKRWGVMKREKKGKEYPPPIPCLARTENLPTSHMPWVLKRYYTDDGRLIIREEKVSNPEYFRAQRSNGRLTLQLVPINQDDSYECEEVEEEREDDGEVVGMEEMREDQMVAGDLLVGSPNAAVTGGGVGGGGGGGGGKGYNYKTVRTSSCLFVKPVPTIRPVQI